MLRSFNGIFYSQEEKAFNWPMIVITTLMIIGLLLYALFSRERLNRLKNERSVNAHYTIGITIARYKNIRMPNPSVEFCYYVNYVKYVKTQSYPYDKDIVSIGGRYYVEFSSNDPNNAKLLIDKEVPELSEAPPVEGWSKLPN